MAKRMQQQQQGRAKQPRVTGAEESASAQRASAQRVNDRLDAGDAERDHDRHAMLDRLDGLEKRVAALERRLPENERRDRSRRW